MGNLIKCLKTLILGFSSIESPYGFDNINKMKDGRLFVNGHSFEWTGFDVADFHPMAAPFHKLGSF